MVHDDGEPRCGSRVLDRDLAADDPDELRRAHSQTLPAPGFHGARAASAGSRATWPQRWLAAREPERGVGAHCVAVTLVQVAGPRAGGLEVGGHAVAVEAVVASACCRR